MRPAPRRNVARAPCDRGPGARVRRDVNPALVSARSIERAGRGVRAPVVHAAGWARGRRRSTDQRTCRLRIWGGGRPLRIGSARPCLPADGACGVREVVWPWLAPAARPHLRRGLTQAAGDGAVERRKGGLVGARLLFVSESPVQPGTATGAGRSLVAGSNRYRTPIQPLAGCAPTRPRRSPTPAAPCFDRLGLSTLVDWLAALEFYHKCAM